ncbi:ABC transporter substrate-binding protein [Nonomuraea sp. NPDC001831]|uniref:ABC transporter substrate-binding protein n=1 Tax=Nonomuraea sp. NPDC001831 TaxID=3364340 RepID=UPI0036B1980C
MRRLRPPPLFLLAALAVLVAACGGAAPGGPRTAGSGAPPEKIRIGVIPIPDSALVYLARDRGYFAAEGLSAEPVTVQGGGPAIDRMKGGALEFGLVNYVTAFLYQRREPGRLKLVADAYHAAPGAFQLFVAPGSPIRSARDLRRSGGAKKSVAVATLRSVGTLSAETVLAAAGVPADDVAFKEIPLPDMPAALAAHAVDVAWMTEPFITAYRRQGGRSLGDAMANVPAGWPIAGWATTAAYAAAHPRAVAGFQRAMAHAQLDARDRRLVTGVLGTYTKIPREVLPTITLGSFPAALEPEGLQSVVDTMVRFRYLPAPLRVESMIVRPAWESGKGNP